MNRIAAIVSAVVLLSPLAARAQAQDAKPSDAPPAAAPAPSPAAGTGRATLRQRFDAADTAHDGHLTMAEAQAAGMRRVVRNFAAIDADHKGYVTLSDIRQFRQARHAARQPGPPSDASGQ